MTTPRTGVKLSPFELLTAFWPQDLNLRAPWARARAEHPLLEDFEVDPYYVLQGIAPAPSCRRGDVLKLRDVTPRQRSIYRGTICLVLGGGARDFHDGPGLAWSAAGPRLAAPAG